MHAIIRRYDGVDENRTAELTDKVNETLVPKLEKLSLLFFPWTEACVGMLGDYVQRHKALKQLTLQLYAHFGQDGTATGKLVDLEEVRKVLTPRDAVRIRAINNRLIFKRNYFTKAHW